MKKTLILLSLLMALPAFGAFPTNTSTKTIDITRLGRDFNDFRFTWNGFEDQFIQFTINENGTGLDVSSFNAMFKVTGQVSGGTNVVFINKLSSDITIVSSNISFTVAHTNIPADATYKAQLLLFQGANTNQTRNIGRGTVRITQSLYDDDDDTFVFPTSAGFETNSLLIENLSRINFTDGFLFDKSGNRLTISVSLTSIGAVTNVVGGTNIVVGGSAVVPIINHADTSSQASVDNSNGNVIQDVGLDGAGHVTNLTSIDLDTRYFTETETENLIAAATNGMSTNVTGLLNGLSVQRPEFRFTSDGTNITIAIDDALQSGSLTYFFNEVPVTFSVPSNLTLTAGATNLVQENWVFVTPTAFGTATARPTGERTILARIGVLDATNTQSSGVFHIQRYTDAITIPDDRSVISRMLERMRMEPMQFENGIEVSISTNVNVGSEDDLFVLSTAGEAWQLHLQTVTAVTAVSPSYHIMNHPNGVVEITNLNAIAVDANGNTVLNNNNSFFNVDVVRCVPSGVTNPPECDIFLLLSTGDYGNITDALDDPEGKRVTSLDPLFIPNTLLLATITLRRQTTGGGTWTATVTDRRGFPLNSDASGAGATARSSIFQDAVFRVVDDGNNTKQLAFQISGISDGTTRTLTPINKSYTIGDILSDGTVPFTGNVDHGANDITNFNNIISYSAGFGNSPPTAGAVKADVHVFDVTGSSTINIVGVGATVKGVVVGAVDLGSFGGHGSGFYGSIDSIGSTNMIGNSANSQGSVTRGTLTDGADVTINGIGVMALVDLGSGDTVTATAGPGLIISDGDATLGHKNAIVLGVASSQAAGSGTAENGWYHGTTLLVSASSVLDSITLAGSAGTNMLIQHFFTVGTNYMAINMVGDPTTNLYPVLIVGQP